MAYPKHFLLSFGGPLGTKETWSCGIRMWTEGLEGLSDTAMEEQASAHVEEVDTKVRAYLNAAGGWLNIHARHGFTKFNPIGGNGRYIGRQTAEVQHTPPYGAPGGSAGPFSIATVITLNTPIRRGLANHGRYFLPTFAFPTDLEGRIQGGIASSLAGSAATFIQNLNNWEGLDTAIAPDVSVVSPGKLLAPRQKGVTPSYGTGTAQRVTEVMVGRVQDTQRRRRAQNTPELYETVEV